MGPGDLLARPSCQGLPWPPPCPGLLPRPRLAVPEPGGRHRSSWKPPATRKPLAAAASLRPPLRASFPQDITVTPSPGTAPRDDLRPSKCRPLLPPTAPSGGVAGLPAPEPGLFPGPGHRGGVDLALARPMAACHVGPPSERPAGALGWPRLVPPPPMWLPREGQQLRRHTGPPPRSPGAAAASEVPAGSPRRLALLGRWVHGRRFTKANVN